MDRGPGEQTQPGHCWRSLQNKSTAGIIQWSILLQQDLYIELVLPANAEPSSMKRWRRLVLSFHGYCSETLLLGAEQFVFRNGHSLVRNTCLQRVMVREEFGNGTRWE